MMTLNRVTRYVCLACALSCSAVSNAETVLHDLSDDWSDTVNPNGVWSVNAGGTPLLHVADLSTTGIDVFPTPQPGFTAQPIFGDITPVWFRAAGPLANGNPEWQIGDIVTHTSRPFVPNSNVTWTSPVDGAVDILGGVWPTREFGRSNDWFLYLNGTLLTSGTISSPDPYDRTNPFLFELGSGGLLAVRDIPVSVGDIVKLEFQQLFGDGEDYTGVDLQIVAASKPTICHVPPGKPGNAHEIKVSESALAAHLANHPGDRLGSC